jgi:uncharacterized repeat protein (TIGR03806 family)
VTARRLIAAAIVLAAAGCSGDDATSGEPEHARDDAGSAPQVEQLDDLGLFRDAVEQDPEDGVIPYDVNAVLYADLSEKLRFINIPDGEQAGYEPDRYWDFPDGTRLVKTFFFYTDARDPSLGRRLIETRIIERAAGKWSGRTYVWDEEQTQATRLKTGKTLEVSWIDAEGEPHTQDYRVPNDNECKTCHAQDHVFEPLGPRTRQLDRDYDYGSADDPDVHNQIEHLDELGLIAGEVPPADERIALVDPYGDAPLEQRARSYLDANCSHCHRPGGEAGSSALDLRWEVDEPHALGVCRRPVAAGPGSGGNDFDIVPGDPDASIMIYRMASTDPEIKMPEMPTLTSDARGTDLIREWIAAMPGDGCD